ncbi:phage regulatory CII family protein [Robbsia sp. Bb-Pol-6]|uniref:Phage regulatory CII family protein n=1 Tax=Robbsia betulipollinis TaxID=2981849 RepID=A0ABT3ZSS9_9BURK|nr:phage regulatory CII family protein [Robbsia betulipollinis]MCY0389605.1 phage regulatory CII family protein [Robbsia betulipollinis]
MHIADAAYAVVHDYPGGAESLAPRLGMSSAVLRNKVNPNNTTHHVTLAEALRLSQITGSRVLIDAFATELGLIVIELPAPENCADGEVLEWMAKTWETNGDIGKEVNATFADSRVEAHEVAKIKDRVFSHIRSLFGLVGRIEGMAEK